MENGVTIVVSKGMELFLAVRMKAKERLYVAIMSCQEERGLTVQVANGDKVFILRSHDFAKFHVTKPGSQMECCVAFLVS